MGREWGDRADVLVQGHRRAGVGMRGHRCAGAYVYIYGDRQSHNGHINGAARARTHAGGSKD